MTNYYLVDISINDKPAHAVVQTPEYRDLSYVGACDGFLAKIDLPTEECVAGTVEDLNSMYYNKAIVTFKRWATKKGIKLNLVAA